MRGDVILPSLTKTKTSHDFKRGKQKKKKLPSSQLFSRWSLGVNYGNKSHVTCLQVAYYAFTHIYNCPVLH